MNKKKTIIGLAIMVAFGSLLLMNFGEQVGGYMDFDQASLTGSRAHVVGEWMRDDHFEYNPTSNTFSGEPASSRLLVQPIAGCLISCLTRFRILRST